MDASHSAAPMAAAAQAGATAQRPGQSKAAQSKEALAWQTIGKRMLKNVKPSVYPVLIHTVPETVSIQDLITSFSSFGTLTDLRYAYTDKTQGVAVGLFRKETSASKVMSLRKKLRRVDQQPPALVRNNNATPCEGPLAAAAAAAAAATTGAAAAAMRPASDPSESGPAGSLAPASVARAPPVGSDSTCKTTPPGPPPNVASDSPGPAPAANLAGSTVPSGDWLHISTGDEAFYYHHLTKSYTLSEPEGAVPKLINWTDEPKRFATAMKCVPYSSTGRRQSRSFTTLCTYSCVGALVQACQEARCTKKAQASSTAE
jgi:hypothetical protein